MTSQEMMKAQAKPGYWFVNVSAVDQVPNWQQQPMQSTHDVNDIKLFGYDAKAFLARQYK